MLLIWDCFVGEGQIEVSFQSLFSCPLGGLNVKPGMSYCEGVAFPFQFSLQIIISLLTSTGLAHVGHVSVPLMACSEALLSSILISVSLNQGFQKLATSENRHLLRLYFHSN